MEVILEENVVIFPSPTLATHITPAPAKTLTKGDSGVLPLGATIRTRSGATVPMTVCKVGNGCIGGFAGMVGRGLAIERAFFMQSESYLRPNPISQWQTWWWGRQDKCPRCLPVVGWRYKPLSSLPVFFTFGFFNLSSLPSPHRNFLRAR